MHMNHKRLPLAALALILIGGASLLLSSCNPSGVGIFYTLQNETPQNTSSAIGTNRTVASMVEYTGSSPAYYIGAGDIFTSPTGSSLNWQKVGENGVNIPDPVCNQIAISGSTLYAVFFSANGTDAYLYSTTLTGSNTSPTWQQVSGFGSTAAAANSFTVQSVFSVGGQLLVSVLYTSSNTYGLYYLSSPGNYQLLSNNLLDVVTSGANDYSGTTFGNGTDWFVAGNKLYTASAPLTLSSTLSTASLPTITTSATFRDIYYSNTLNKTLFVSTSAGGIFAYNGGSWSGNIAKWPSSIAPTGIDGFAELTVGGYDVMLIGTDTGYYEWDISASSAGSYTPSSTPNLGQPGNTTTQTATVNYVSSNLAAALVLGFFPNSGPSSGDLFALTGAGLWLNTTNSSGARAWTQE